MNRASGFAGRSRQRGAVLLFAAMGISTLIVTASLIDLGLLYQYRREYQKAADLAALAGAQNLFDGCGVATTAANLSVARNLGERGAATVECGAWRRSPTPTFDTGVPANEQRAVQVTINGSPPGVLSGIASRNLTATAIAITDQPIAALTLRTSLLSIDVGQSALLNEVFTELLGGSINLTAGDWNGLLQTDVSLLSYMDALAVNLGLSAGNHTGVLNAMVTAGDLVDAAIDVLNQGGGTGEVAAGLAGLQSLALAIPGVSPLLRVGDLLAVEAGAEAFSLDTALNLFQLVQGGARLGSPNAVVEVDLPVTIPGVASVTTKLSAVQAGVPVAVGNPEWATADPLGLDGIIVSSGNVRALVSLELPVLGSTLSALQTLLTDDALIGVTGAVNGLLSLDLTALVSLLSCLIACDEEYDITDVQVLPTPRVDLLVDAGSGRANVNGYDCETSKALNVPTQTAAAAVRVGSLGSTPAAVEVAAFSGDVVPDIAPVALLDIGSYRARYQCTLLLICSTRWRRGDGTWASNKAEAQRTPFSGGGIGLRLGSGDSGATIAGASDTLPFSEPPDGGLPDLGNLPVWQEVASSDVIGSLSGTLGNLEVVFYQPSNGNVLGGVLALAGSAVEPLVDELEALIVDSLSPLLDPLINDLLATLGANLAETEVGANLTCDGGGATLVQ